MGHVSHAAMKAEQDESNQEVLLLDITPVSILLRDHRGDFVRVIHRNSAIPTKKTRDIVLSKDGVQQVDVSVSP